MESSGQVFDPFAVPAYAPGRESFCLQICWVEILGTCLMTFDVYLLLKLLLGLHLNSVCAELAGDIDTNSNVIMYYTLGTNLQLLNSLATITTVPRCQRFYGSKLVSQQPPTTSSLELGRQTYFMLLSSIILQPGFFRLVLTAQLWFNIHSCLDDDPVPWEYVFQIINALHVRHMELQMLIKML